MECGKDKNLTRCPCTWHSCSRKGICCECLDYHLAQRELPACAFPTDVERTYDRSFARFVRTYPNG